MVPDFDFNSSDLPKTSFGMFLKRWNAFYTTFDEDDSDPFSTHRLAVVRFSKEILRK